MINDYVSIIRLDGLYNSVRMIFICSCDVSKSEVAHSWLIYGAGETGKLQSMLSMMKAINVHLSPFFSKENVYSIMPKALVTNAITNCYERCTNDFQTMEIREDNGKTGRFVRNYRSTNFCDRSLSKNKTIDTNKVHVVTNR